MLANSHHPEMKKQKIKEQAFSQRNILKIIFFHYKKFPYVSVLFDRGFFSLPFTIQFTIQLTAYNCFVYSFNHPTKAPPKSTNYC